MFNELAAFILALLFAMFLVHVVQGAAGKDTSGLTWFKSFFSKANQGAGQK